MAFCSSCGGRVLDPAARFCSTCGKSLASVDLPLAPAAEPPDETFPSHATRERGAGVPVHPVHPVREIPVPGWVTSDWPVVGLTALFSLVLVAAAMAAIGVVAGLVATGRAAGLVTGGVAGAYASFAAYGARAAVVENAGGVHMIVAVGAWPIAWTVMAGTLMMFPLRFGLARLRADDHADIAFVAKHAIGLAVLAGLAARLLRVGVGGSQSNGFHGLAAWGATFWGALFVAAVAGFVIVIRPRGLPFSLPSAPAWPAVRHQLGAGLMAFASMSAIGAGVVFLSVMVVADDLAERVLYVLTLPFHVVNTGVAASAVSMGSTVHVSTSTFLGRGGYSLSLFHFGFPGAHSAGPWLLLLVMPVVALVWWCRRTLLATPPANQQEALQIGFLIAMGFVATALVAGWFARFLGFAFVDRLHHGNGAVTFAPALTPLTGLAVVWGLAIGLGTAFWWSWSRGLQWTTGAVAGPSDAPPPAA